MKKTLFFLSLVIMSIVGLSSCGDDSPSGGGLKGWYAAELPSKGSDDWGGKAYHFTNKNTCIYYSMISGSPRWTGFSESLPSPLSGYYVQSGCGETYTYEVIDNKVYIPMQGVILTIDGKTLSKDGSGTRFTKR